MAGKRSNFQLRGAVLELDGKTSLINMEKRPLAVICIFFIIGIILARFLPDSLNF